MLRDGKSGVVTGFRAMGDGRASPDAPFQQVPRAERPAAEAEGGGEVGGRPPPILARRLTAWQSLMLAGDFHSGQSRSAAPRHQNKSADGMDRGGCGRCP